MLVSPQRAKGGTRAIPAQIKKSKSRLGIRMAALPREQASDGPTPSACGDSRDKETQGIPHSNDDRTFGSETERLRDCEQNVCQAQSHEAGVSVPLSDTKS
jgi:hypothetical protein